MSGRVTGVTGLAGVIGRQAGAKQGQAYLEYLNGEL